MKIIIKLCLPIFLLLSGCVYFNTFYMAQRNFKIAEIQFKRDKGVSPKNKSNYTNSIEAAAEVVRDFPDSKYVDDSLFIIGVSYYRTGDYTRALGKFNEIQQAFPNSEFADESKYYKALSLIETERYDDARILLNELIVNENRSLKGRSGLALANISLRDESWDDLLKSAQNIIDSKPEKEELYSAYAYKGDALFRLERYDECIATLEKMLTFKIDASLKFRGNLLVASAKAKLGNFEESLNYLDKMQGRGEFAAKADSIRLQMGEIQELKGDKESAMETYRKLTGDKPDSLSSKKAYFLLGNLLIEDLSKSEDAKEAYDNVKKNKARTTEQWALDAETKSTQIETMEALIEDIEEAEEDSLKKAGLRFTLAELLMYSFGRPDSALSQYQFIIEEAPGTDFAVRSEYFLGLHELRDSDSYSEEADNELMEDIIEKYPESAFTQRLKVHLGLIEKPPEIVEFLKAEKAKLSGEDPELYMPMYRAVADSFPDTEAACKSLFAMAYFYEHELDEKETALELYKELAEIEDPIFGKTYIKYAKDKLSLDKDEEKIIKEIEDNIDKLAYEALRYAEYTPEETDTSVPVKEQKEELTRYRKIRARNARIRSRYYSD
ncbi:tetratricopeptide repeat protein [Candidatus Latescibacterota bacterium]